MIYYFDSVYVIGGLALLFLILLAFLKFMKRKSNIFLLFLTVFFLIFSSNVTQAATITLSRPQPAASGKFVASGKYWTYQYDDKTIAKNVFIMLFCYVHILMCCP